MKRVATNAITPGKDNEHSYLQRGHIFLQAAHYTAALAAYQQAYRLNPTNADILLWEARTLVHLQRPYDALVVIEQALQIQPSLAGARQEQHAILAQLGHATETG